MKLQLSYLYDSDDADRDDVSVYAAEGRVQQTVGFVGHGNMVRSGTDAVLAVVCRGDFATGDKLAAEDKLVTEDKFATDDKLAAEDKSSVTNEAAAEKNTSGEAGRAALTKRFEQWFQHEFQQNLEPFSIDVTKRYWQSIVYEAVDRAACSGSGDGRAGPEFAALLVYRDQYVFCGMGKLTVCEYSFQKKCFRRWYIGEERKALDRELGIPEAEISDITFLHGSVSSGTLYLILPRQIRLDHPKKIKHRYQLQRYIDRLGGQVSAAVAIHASNGIGIRGQWDEDIYVNP